MDGDRRPGASVQGLPAAGHHCTSASIGGAAPGLILYSAALDLSSTIGVLMLMGIVCKNSILLVDYAIEARNAGMDRRSALLKAGTTRALPSS
ncbi:efflux RND transporter permease subunit [Mesorhizobium sp. INR15]|uniref:efflux RND transporter permease subunit n=1 Tax=Mesorhizobium sp. INR15 TaxID=2654248 RepID=UPI0027E4923D|nr:efflux RND transporter permease subunit [Mesorhizobium sp. INR15]